MGRGQGPATWLCGGCRTALQPDAEGTVLSCPRCGESYREGSPAAPAPAGDLALRARGLGLIGVEWAYRAGMVGGSAALLTLGGFVRVADGWLRDEVASWGDVVEALGGVRLVVESKDPDADLGPVLAYADAPGLFTAVQDVARRLGARPPEQIRLSYLPCCGVTAGRGRRSRALMIGMPLLHVLSVAELRAILAHELAHLARGDATRSARSARFVQGLGRALDGPPGRSGGPLRRWAQLCRRGGAALLAPIALGQEARADRTAAAIAGGDAAAAALVKVALVQPLFREVLDHYDPSRPDAPNLYAFFRAFWARLPEPVLTAMRRQILSNRQPIADAHPPLLDRLAVVQAYPSRRPTPTDRARASAVLGDLEALERMLHDRLFGGPAVEPSIFHRAGT